MTHEQLLQHLAIRARKIYNKLRDPSWGLAIHIACDGSNSLKKEVGSVLGKRGVVKKKIAKIKRLEKVKLDKGPKQLRFNF